MIYTVDKVIQLLHAGLGGLGLAVDTVIASVQLLS